jgi:hypothetical protein
VVAGRDGYFYVLTANHVVANAHDIQVHTFPTGDKPGPVLTDAVVLLQAADADLALLRLPAGSVKVTPLALPPPGTKLGGESFTGLSVGCAADGPPECRAEKIAGKRLLRRPNGVAAFVWETAEKPDHGRSGGPLLDARGRLVGVCSGTQDGKGYYSHLDEIHAAFTKRKYDWIWQTDRPVPE